MCDLFLDSVKSFDEAGFTSRNVVFNTLHCVSVDERKLSDLKVTQKRVVCFYTLHENCDTLERIFHLLRA